MNPADSLDEDALDSPLGRDLTASVMSGSDSRLAICEGPDPLSAFRGVIRRVVRDIESHPRGVVLQRWLVGEFRSGSDALCEDESISQPLSDEEVGLAIRFLRHHVVPKFQGGLAELLAIGPCAKLVGSLIRGGLLPAGSRLYMGGLVRAPRVTSSVMDQVADGILIEQSHEDAAHAVIGGVLEVKSYRSSPRRLRRQVDQHLDRMRQGLRVEDRDYRQGQVTVGLGSANDIVRIVVEPASWKLPRTITWEPASRRLELRESTPPDQTDTVTQVGPHDWRVTLRWSHEALAARAHILAFWYLAKVGESLWPERSPWPEMTPGEAGQNAAMGAMNAAPLRAQTQRDYLRAITLCNILSFGYALGNSFRSPSGDRRILWPVDLDEIVATGCTRDGFRCV